jgi:cytochrome c-type protein NapC
VAAPTALVFAVIIFAALLAITLAARPGVTHTRGGKILAFVALFILPVLATALGTEEHMERSKRTEFCLSCHVMQPYGRSLMVDSPSYLPAAHYQNHRVPADQACYTCHTDYVLYGSFRAKLRGLRHVYKNYIGKPSQPIRLYNAYNNRECLHCHLGARSFEENAVHTADAGTFEEIKSNKMSCLTSGCHDTVHNANALGDVKMWKGSTQ